MRWRRMMVRASWSVVLLAAAALATSHVRIVRLSYVDGKVQMDRANGQGLERAILNAPIVEGSRIVTSPDGLAEVEFENNTTVRLGEATDVRFSQLLINDAGDKVNEVELVRGTMYFDTRSGKDEIDRVKFAGQSFVLRRDSQVRFQTSGDQIQASVFNGEVTLDRDGRLSKLKKDEIVTLDSTNPDGYQISKGVTSQPLDRWNSERHAYQQAYAYNNYDLSNRGLSASGFQDLAYYGAFMNVPGYGLAWQPYGVNSWAAWNPYMSGAWTFTNGYGYAWASAYPWGWMPYHYGSWAYQGGMGWFWVPGNSFGRGGVVTNWQATAPVMSAPTGYAAPNQPVTAMQGPKPTVTVGRLGNTPAYLPDGPVPPNFRSVITDHSGLAGQAGRSSYLSGSAGSTNAATSAGRNSRAYNPATSKLQNGHVFAPPATNTMMPSMNAQGYIPPASMGGSAASRSMHGSGMSMQDGGAPMRGSGNAMGTSGGRASHGSGSSGGRTGSAPAPK